MDGVAILTIIIALFCLVSARLESNSLTKPIVFVFVGLILGAHGLNLISLVPEAETIKAATEITLALLLFADASTLSFWKVMKDAPLAGRLLSIGLLLCIALGSLVGYILFSTSGIAIALILGAALAPTDAALGLAIFTNPNVPARIRSDLNVESGLNDGIVTPFVTLFIAMASAAHLSHEQSWINQAIREIGIALIVGVAIGFIGGKLLLLSNRRGWGSEDSDQIAVLAFAASAYFASTGFDGNGFIAAFVGGIAYGAATRHSLPSAVEYTETTGTLLSILVWTVFGAVFVPLAIDDFFNWRVVLYAILSLTMIRMIPVAIALHGEGMRRDTVLVMGWFGPRGLASVVFMIAAFLALDEAGKPVNILIGAMSWTILLSVVAHGISARPIASWYGARLSRAHGELAEMQETPDIPIPKPHVLGTVTGWLSDET